MARVQKLKVYRTVAGFYDAYVAAPSQKAALAAWGSDRDLFARGIAEQVTDPALIAEPLASPGTVVKHSRGTTAEQIAALPEQRAPAAPRDADADADPKPTAKPRAKPQAKPKPRPKRDELDAAEEALTSLRADFNRKKKDLAEREAALAQDRRALEQARSSRMEAAEDALRGQKQAYEEAVRRWRASQD
ncbi:MULTISPECIES: hypothetical protein [unclassified Sphingomonas]|uniref:hypothetical protein n=1 Tax=unclassified Sphingomonas TaxID=196159 RepID=UPI000E72600B|nr:MULTISPECIES: hypothetical protein [unclassified Sphingomonas]RKE49956.1 hypothetical protein C8J39_1513 [Sphingomonas sp. PP-CC-1A-547]TCM08287.1 hypothetical protein C8J41_102250 [Sphingomonas sp. PP-CC-3G-468]